MAKESKGLTYEQTAVKLVKESEMCPAEFAPLLVAQAQVYATLAMADAIRVGSVPVPYVIRQV